MIVVLYVVTAQLPGARGYTGGKVIFIDTENTLYVAYICCVCMYAAHICVGHTCLAVA